MSKMHPQQELQVQGGAVGGSVHRPHCSCSVILLTMQRRGATTPWWCCMKVTCKACFSFTLLVPTVAQTNAYLRSVAAQMVKGSRVFIPYTLDELE